MPLIGETIGEYKLRWISALVSFLGGFFAALICTIGQDIKSGSQLAILASELKPPGEYIFYCDLISRLKFLLVEYRKQKNQFVSYLSHAHLNNLNVKQRKHLKCVLFLIELCYLLQLSRFLKFYILTLRSYLFSAGHDLKI